MFFPYESTTGSTAYQPNTIYDLVVTRDGATNAFVAYIVDSATGCAVVSTEFNMDDSANDALPFVTSDSKTRLGFFFDDNTDHTEATDAGTVYNVTIWQDALTAAQIKDAMSNHSPVITSNGGGATASIQVFDGHTGSVTTVTATDADSDTLTYRLNGGVDATHFQIDGTTGVLTFNSPPDFNTPTDADNDNHYEVTVQADDGKGGTANQDLTIEVVPNGIAVHNSGAISYNASATAKLVAPNLTITFSSVSNLDEAKVNIANGYQNGADVLGIQG